LNVANPTSQVISGYLAKIGWFNQIRDPRTVLTGYHCPIPFYNYSVLIEVISSEHWVTIRSFLHRNVGVPQRVPMLQLLSSMNRQCRSVRFLLTEECVLVQAEIPAVRCHQESFLEALKAICRYGAAAALEVSTVATDPLVAELIESVEELSTPRGRFPAGDLDLDEQFQFSISVNRLTD
jgi:hypothetical protein